MGIRIHKTLGYAIRGIRFSKKSYTYTDKRINPLGYLGLDTDHESKEDIWTLDGYLRYCKYHLDSFNYHWEKLFFKKPYAKGVYWDIYKYVIEDIEYGIPGVLMFVPTTNSMSWNRYDNTIDYYEHYQQHEKSIDSLHFLNVPLYPYSGYMNSLTGQVYKKEQATIARHFSSTVRDKKNQKPQLKKKSEIFIEVCAKALNFESVKKAKKNIAPEIPPELITLIRYLCIFENDETIFQLRPAIYTYWG